MKRMTFGIEAVSPQIAAEFLSCSGGNRKPRKSRLEKYCRSRRANQWILTHQGLAFDWNGRFLDGHHRCMMIIETGLTTDFVVFRNLNPEAAKYIDCGLPRNAHDALAMAGLGDYGCDLLSVCRCFECAPLRMCSRDLTTDEILETLERNAEPIQWACNALKGSQTGISRATRTLLARAWKYHDTERLEEFAEILRTGVPKSVVEDQAAITFRNFLTASASRAGERNEIDRYRKGQTALDAFCARKPLTKVYGTEKDLFPVDGDGIP